MLRKLAFWPKLRIITRKKFYLKMFIRELHFLKLYFKKKQNLQLSPLYKDLDKITIESMDILIELYMKKRLNLRHIDIKTLELEKLEFKISILNLKIENMK